ncbi:MAG: flippase [Pseudomonadota bacterium]
MSTLRRMTKSTMVRTTGAMLGVRALSVLIGIALSVLLARWLAPEGYGIYLFTLTIAKFLALPIVAGLPTLVVREVAIARGQADNNGLWGLLLWSAGFLLGTTCLASILTAAYVGISNGSSNGQTQIYLIAIPLVLSLAVLRVSSAVLQGHEHPFAGNLGDGFIRPSFLLIFIFVAVTFGVLTPTSALWFHVIAASLAASFAMIYWWVFCRDLLPNERPTPHYETRKWLKSLVPLSLTTAASLISKRTDILMLGFFSQITSVAVYGIAAQLSGLVVMGQTIVNSIVAPKIARLYRQERPEELRNMLTKAARLSTGIAVCVCGFIFFLGSQIVDLLLDDGYSDAWPIAMILCLGTLFSSAMGPTTSVLTMTGHEKVMVRLVWQSALANVLLNALLIPKYGGVGAAVATTSSLVFLQLSMALWISRKLGLDTTIVGRNVPTADL